MAAGQLFYYVAMAAACCATTTGRPPAPEVAATSRSEARPGHGFGHRARVGIRREQQQQPPSELDDHSFGHRVNQLLQPSELDDHSFGHRVNQLQQPSEQHGRHHSGDSDGDRQQPTEDDVPPAVGSSYHFAYAVQDPLTGDVKSQNEVSDGRGTVRGAYSLVEPDGSTRVVEYSADDERGFNAEVKRIAPQHRYAATSVDPPPESRPSSSPAETVRSAGQQKNVHFYVPREYVIASARRR